MTGERDRRDTGGRNQSVKTFSGYKKLKSLSRGVVNEDKERISESEDTNYLEEEDRIFNLNKEVTDLLDGLQNRNTKNETKAQ